MLALLTLHILGRARRAGVLGDDLDEQGWAKLVAGGIRQLRRSLGRHPDVAALAEQWPTGSRGRRPLQIPSTPWPPLLAASLDLLLAADARRPDVIPAGSLTEAVSGQRYTSIPWLLWDPEGLSLEPTPQRPPRSRGAAWQVIPWRGRYARRNAHREAPQEMWEGSGGGPSSAGPANLGGLSSSTEPLAAELRPTTVPATPIAVERVEDLVRGVAQVLQLPPAEAAQRLGNPRDRTPARHGRRDSLRFASTLP